MTEACLPFDALRAVEGIGEHEGAASFGLTMNDRLIDLDGFTLNGAEP